MRTIVSRQRVLGLLGALAVSALIVFGLNGVAGASSADTVMAQLYGAPGWYNSTPGSWGPNSLDTTQSVCTGIYELALEPGSGQGTGVGLLTNSGVVTSGTMDIGPNNGQSVKLLNTFCADMWQDAPQVWTSYQLLTVGEWQAALITQYGASSTYGLISDSQAKSLEQLFYNYFAAGISGNPDYATAFQACVWEIENGTPGNYNVLTGSFKELYSDSNAWFLANAWLASVEPGSSLPAATDMTVLYNASTQDYAFYTTDYSPDIGSVPEPVTVFGVLLGVGALGRYWSRKRRSA